jgi:hypothetical protein
VPLSQLKTGDVYFVFYERLRTDPSTELQKLFLYLSQRFDHGVLKRLSIPSAMSQNGSQRVFSTDPSTNDVQGTLSGEDTRAAMRIVSAFGLDQIYRDQRIPEPGVMEKLLGAQSGR